MIPARPEFPPRPRPHESPSPPPPATRPKANDADTPTLPPRHATPQEIPPNGSTPFSPGLTPPAASSPPAVSPVPGPLPAPLGGAPSARAFRPRLSARAFPLAPFHPRLSTRASSPRTMLDCCRVSSTILVRRARHHAYLSPLTPQPDGYLSLEQFNECGVLPDRFGRVPHSLKVNLRGGVAAGVSGGREDDAAGDTGQGERTCPRGRPVARHRVEHAAEWVGRRL
jgi:hypothetical protein